MLSINGLHPHALAHLSGAAWDLPWSCLFFMSTAEQPYKKWSRFRIVYEYMSSIVYSFIPVKKIHSLHTVNTHPLPEQWAASCCSLGRQKMSCSVLSTAVARGVTCRFYRGFSQVHLGLAWVTVALKEKCLKMGFKQRKRRAGKQSWGERELYSYWPPSYPTIGARVQELPDN